MPDISALLIGPQYVMVSNSNYAMPARATRGYVNVTTGLETSMTNGTTSWTALTITAGEFNTAAPFLRCTTGPATVRLVAL
jgi:hypothetical protein